MKITFVRQELANVISPLLCATSNKSTIKAIEGVLIEASNVGEDGICNMTSFDLEKGIRICVSAQVEEPGSCIINAQKFAQTVKVMEGDKITLTVNEKNNATIVSGISSHSMTALDAAEFPEIPKLSGNNGFIIKQGLLRSMFGKVSYAMAVNEQRNVLNGCFVKLKDNNLCLVACDSYKMAKCASPAETENIGEAAPDYSFILPTKSVTELSRLLHDGDEKTTVYMSHRYFVADLDGVIFFSRLISGEYIDYDRFIMKNHKIFVEVDRAELISALERAALVTEEKIVGSVRTYVRISVEGDIMKILADSAAGSTYDEIKVNHEGDDIYIAFSNRYLIDSLSACTADIIKLCMTSPLSSINIIPAGDCTEDEFFMLLPVRMKE